MKIFIRKLFVPLIILCGAVAWGYSTGNMPNTAFALHGMPYRLHLIFPKFTRDTDQFFEKTWRFMRKTGVDIPPSHNERILHILKLRCEISYICRSILGKRVTQVKDK